MAVPIRSRIEIGQRGQSHIAISLPDSDDKLAIEWHSLDPNPRTMRLAPSFSPSPKISYLFENPSDSSIIELVTEVSSDPCECCVDSSECESTICIVFKNNTGFI
jgi:hypothetical protein